LTGDVRRESRRRFIETAIWLRRDVATQRNTMGKYATISVPADVKKVLEKAKGRHEWGEFLFSLYSEATGLNSKRAFEELTSLLTTEDLESILKTSREFRERLSFRSATNG